MKTLGLMAGGTPSPDGIKWTYQDGLTRDRDLTIWNTRDTVYDIIWNGSKFVAAGSGCRIASSTDGTTWTVSGDLYNSANWQKTSYTFEPNAGERTKVAWNGTYFCVVGEYSNCAVSSDGISWYPTTAFQTLGFSPRAIAYGAGKFVAVGFDGKGYTSPDGLTWTANDLYTKIASTNSNGTLFGIIYAGGKFVAVGGAYGRAVCATSTDGVTWTLQTIGGSCSSVAWNGSKYVAIGQTPSNGNGGCYTSPDGVTWTSNTGLSSLPQGAAAYRQVIWDGSRFIAIGDISILCTSTDGVTWTFRSNVNGNANYVKTICWNGSKYLVGTTYAGLWTSTDATIGSTWAKITNLSREGEVFGNTFVQSLTYSNGKFLASSSSAFATSVDGITWNIIQSPTVYKPVWDGSKYIGIGRTNYKYLYTSTDLINWSSPITFFNGKTFTPSDLHVSGTNYCLFGGSSSTKGYATTDINSWTAFDLSTTAWGTTSRTAAAASPTLGFIVGGNNGAIATSPDGLTWTYQGGLIAAGCTYYIYSIIWAGDRWIAKTGTSGSYSIGTAISMDGITWTFTDYFYGYIYPAISTNFGYNRTGTLTVGGMYSYNNGNTWLYNDLSSLQPYFINYNLGMDKIASSPTSFCAVVAKEYQYGIAINV